MIGEVHRRLPSWAWVALPVALASTLVAEVWLRFSGPWAESDTVTVSRTIRGVLNQHTIEPSNLAYSNGFNYPTLAAFVVSVTGLSVKDVQTLLLPWLLPMTALVAFVTFRAITGSGRAGAICALLLLIQADFLFVSQRGSHEKITWPLVLLIVFCLIRSLSQRAIGHAAPFVAVIYLCAFAIICTNVFFSSSLITVFFLSFVVGAIATVKFMRDRAVRRIIPRLGYIFITLGILIYLFISIIYPTARSNFEPLKSAVDRIAVLYLGVETTQSTPSDATSQQEGAATQPVPSTPDVQAVSPYRSIASTWVSRNVFLALTGFTWILLLYAGVGWLIVTLRFVRYGVSRDEVPLFLTWAFAAATALQIAGSVAADFAGVFGANLQLRLFPAFTLFAIPLVVITFRLPARVRRRRSLLQRLLPAFGLLIFAGVAVAYPIYAMLAVPIVFVAAQYVSFSRWPVSLRQVAMAVGVVAFAGFAFAACLKATNDPLVSNRWTFYSQSEARGIRWGIQYLPRQYVWSEYDERLKTAAVLLAVDAPTSGATGAIWTSGISGIVVSPYLLVSDITAERSARSVRAVPDTHDHDLIYDNGEVQIAHQVPKTPYQP